MNTYSIIRNAILNKKQIHATCLGHKREMCPHLIGRTRDGIDMCLFYQFAGSSNSDGKFKPGMRGKWKMIRISSLTNVCVVNGDWFTGDTSPMFNMSKIIKIKDLAVDF